MDITRAFPLDVPRLDLAWGLTEQAFLEMLRPYRPQKITNGHYEMRCRFFGLPESPVHFHFEPRTDGRLSQVEFFRKPQRQKRKGFDQLQRSLEKYLGVPTRREQARSDEVHPVHWQLGKVSVAHEYYYHGGHYEKVLFTTRAA
jgi:hypothetical protein